jgi:tetratricopeptide (TPR) repeat protein
MQGDLEPARAYGEASFSIAKEAGDLEGAGRALLVLGYIALDGSDYESAESLHRQALAAFRECGSDRRVRITLGMLGFDAIAQKDYDEARRVLEEALILSRIADDSRGVQVATANLGFALVCQGRSEEARIHLRESLLLAHETSDVVNTSLELEDIAGLAAAQEDCEAAAVLLGGAAEFLEATGFWRDPVMEELRQQTIAILREKLEGEDLRQSWERGRKMPIDELVAYAVDFVDSSGRG